MPSDPGSIAKPTSAWRPLWRRLAPAGLCFVCRSGCQGGICPSCRRRWSPADETPARCMHCGLRLGSHPSTRRPACLQQTSALDHTVVGLDYAFPWDGLIQAYKFRAALHLRDLLLGPLMAALAQDAAAHTCDLLLSVPLSASGLRRRGYNQSHELAKPLARRLRLPYEPLALERIQHSHAQSLLPKSERSRNVKGAFIVRPDALPRLQGRRVAIIDDVMTTGATLFELASLLKRNGAAQVQAWVIARA